MLYFGLRVCRACGLQGARGFRALGASGAQGFGACDEKAKEIRGFRVAESPKKPSDPKPV